MCLPKLTLLICYLLTVIFCFFQNLDQNKDPIFYLILSNSIKVF